MYTRRVHGRLLLALSLAFLVFVNASAEDWKKPATEALGTAALTPCKLPGVTQPSRCGVFEVPENPEQPVGRQLPISVVVIPATDGPATSDPIVPLMGGPGEDAISAATLFGAQLTALRRDRDLLLVDQRGTGRSGSLRCNLYSTEQEAANLRDLFPLSAVKACKRTLEAHADLTQYTYTHFANDLEHIRRALDYGPLNLLAGSYGTRAAQVYVRAYEQSVRTVYLGSAVPIDVPTPLAMAKSAQMAFENTFDACEADADCDAAFPNLRHEFRTILARLESGDVQVSVQGQTGTVAVNRGRVVEWFRAKLYRPSSAAELPWLIHQAYEENWDPIVDGILSQAREVDTAISLGLFFSITCNEDVAFIREEDIVPETQNTFLGDYRLRQQQAACKHWPRVSLPKDYRMPVQSSVPTLFVSGDRDGASPLWFTERIVPGFTNRIEVVLHGRGHTEWSECVGNLYQRFVRLGTVHGLDASSCEPAPRPPFKTNQRGEGR